MVLRILKIITDIITFIFMIIYIMVTWPITLIINRVLGIPENTKYLFFRSANLWMVPFEGFEPMQFLIHWENGAAHINDPIQSKISQLLRGTRFNPMSPRLHQLLRQSAILSDYWIFDQFSTSINTFDWAVIIETWSNPNQKKFSQIWGTAPIKTEGIIS